jgi:hypothetical protein
MILLSARASADHPTRTAMTTRILVFFQPSIGECDDLREHNSEKYE